MAYYRSFGGSSGGCALDPLGLVLGVPVAFLVWVIMGAVTADWRDATRAGAVVALIGLGIMLIGWLFAGVRFVRTLAAGLALMSFPTAMYHWSIGNAHGYAWLWIVFWMCAVSTVVVFLTWVSGKVDTDY